MKKKKIILLTCTILLLMSIISSAKPTMGAIPIAKEDQERSNWCWAACGVTVLDYYDNNVSQSTFVKKVKGEIVNETGYLSEIQDGLSYWDLSSKKTGTLSLDTIEDEIYYRKRPIIGAMVPNAHSVVVDGYDLEGNGYVEYMDPDGGVYKLVTYDKFNSKLFGAIYKISK